MQQSRLYDTAVNLTQFLPQGQCYKYSLLASLGFRHLVLRQERAKTQGFVFCLRPLCRRRPCSAYVHLQPCEANTNTFVRLSVRVKEV
jgi:hypothetical protein